MTQDHAEAARWYRKAADQGDTQAQAYLGIMYFNGQGIAQDYVQSHMWMNLAASRASGDDQKRIAGIRDDVASKMSAAQIAEAQRLARDWKPNTETNR